MNKIYLKICIIFILVLIPVIVLAYPKGDVDGNGAVCANDYLLVRKHILHSIQLTGDALNRANVDGQAGANGELITTNDYIIIRKIILEKTDSTDCAKAPSPSDLSRPQITIEPLNPTPTLDIITPQITFSPPTPEPTFDLSKPQITVDPNNDSGKQNTVKFYGVDVVDPNLNYCSILTITNDIENESKSSEYFVLSMDKEYVISFNYKAQSGSHNFEVDVNGKNEINLLATDKTQHYDMIGIVGENDQNYNLRFVYNPEKDANKGSDINKTIKISNVLVGTIEEKTVKTMSKIGTLPIAKRDGYTFLGWYTSPLGGTKVTEVTPVTKNIVLYSRWELKTENQYSTSINHQENYTVETNYNSNTFKYWIEKNSNTAIAHIWLKDPYNQFRVGMIEDLDNVNNQSHIKKGKLPTILAKELNLNKTSDLNTYSQKSVIASNSSFFGVQKIEYLRWGRTQYIPYILHNGKVVRDDTNFDIVADGSGAEFTVVYGTYGLTRNLELKQYNTSSKAVKNQKAKHEIQEDEVKYTGGSTGYIVQNGVNKGDTTTNPINALCQINSNNFIVAHYTNRSTSYKSVGDQLINLGCKTVINIDGGGSIYMYYINKETNQRGRLTGVFGSSGKMEDRSYGDILYFTE